jgi:RimJ/RimL family protein N-acetyltransferase
MKYLENYKILKNRYFKKENFELCPILPIEIEKIRIWRNQQLRNLRQNKKISNKEQIKYFDNIIFKEYSSSYPENIIFSFKKNSILIGYGGLVHISWNDFRAEVSLTLQTKIENNKRIKFSYFKIFLDLIRELAFHDIKLKKITTETYSFRKKEINFLERYGFKREGVLKKNIYIKKKSFDSYLHAINFK